MLGADFTLALLEEDDPPLLALNDATRREVERSERAFARSVPTEGPIARVRRHVEERRATVVACTTGGHVEVVARWDRGGHVTFGAERARASCVKRALGDLRLDVRDPGEHRVLVAR
jgi:hypothetical protein